MQAARPFLYVMAISMTVTWLFAGTRSRENGAAYEIRAKKVLCATGGTAGLYKPNNPGFSRHKMWYPPFNTGAGYAMGIDAGAEMTTFEMRFIALRCKDTIAPTGTIAQGVGAKQVNSKPESKIRWLLIQIRDFPPYRYFPRKSHS